ncbi:hypothetical protein SDC9_100814 [bioreactor metagenome]|uniref:Uncharacterized protein n=1 Tax=bioreactor metagenome TaxID=1076179 RepID=A0A645AP15_9ZZZZ
MAAGFLSFKAPDIPGALPTPHRVTQPVQPHNHRPGGKAPQPRKLGADLPQQISRHMGIVPYTPAQPQIDDAPGKELRRRDGKAA